MQLSCCRRRNRKPRPLRAGLPRQKRIPRILAKQSRIYEWCAREEHVCEEAAGATAYPRIDSSRNRVQLFTRNSCEAVAARRRRVSRAAYVIEKTNLPRRSQLVGRSIVDVAPTVKYRGSFASRRACTERRTTPVDNNVVRLSSCSQVDFLGRVPNFPSDSPPQTPCVLCARLSTSSPLHSVARIACPATDHATPLKKLYYRFNEVCTNAVSSVRSCDLCFAGGHRFVAQRAKAAFARLS